MIRNSLLKSVATALALVYIHLSLTAVEQIAPDGAVADPVPVFSWQEDPTANWYLLWISDADNTQTLYQQWQSADANNHRHRGGIMRKRLEAFEQYDFVGRK